MNSQRLRPDFEFCKTSHYFSTYWECLIGSAGPIRECPYLLELKQRCYCMHNDRKDFGQKT